MDTEAWAAAQVPPQLEGTNSTNATIAGAMEDERLQMVNTKHRNSVHHSGMQGMAQGTPI